MPQTKKSVKSTKTPSKAKKKTKPVSVQGQLVLGKGYKVDGKNSVQGQVGKANFFVGFFYNLFF